MPTTLTNDQLLDFREDINDNPQDETLRMFADDRLQYFYNKAELLIDTFPNTEALARVYAWEKIAAAAVGETDYTMTLTSEKRSQLTAHVEKRLEYWRGEAGLGAGQMLIGTIDYGIDEKEETGQWS